MKRNKRNEPTTRLVVRHLQRSLDREVHEKKLEAIQKKFDQFLEIELYKLQARVDRLEAAKFRVK